MDFEQLIDFIENKMNYGCKPGLERVNDLLSLLGDPQKKLKVIHIAGTNGKGSVSAVISNILTCAGYKTGMYTSPHLYSITERMKINGKEISKEDFLKYGEFVIHKMEIMKLKGKEEPTQFEMLTAMAFLYFYEKEVDFLVLEVGLGGALDATNVVEAILSVITSVSYDHTDVLGNTIEKIATEKAGIIKNNSITILYPQIFSNTTKVIEDICFQKNNKLVFVKKDFGILKSFQTEGQIFDYMNENLIIENIQLPLIGDHQILNACTSITAILELMKIGYDIKVDAIIKGIATVSWPCRMSIVSTSPLLIIDGAHNEDGINSLKNALMKYFNDKKIIFIIAMLKDKDYDYAAKTLAPIGNMIITTKADSPRALSAERLADTFSSYSNNVKSIDSVKDAIEYAMAISDKDSMICICGSLYMAGVAYRILSNN